MNMKILILALLVVLVLMSFVQAIQMNNLEKSFKGLNLDTKQTSNAISGAYSNPPSNVPTMVGGC